MGLMGVEASMGRRSKREFAARVARSVESESQAQEAV